MDYSQVFFIEMEIIFLWSFDSKLEGAMKLKFVPFCFS